jgi:hypothetical protein
VSRRAFVVGGAAVAAVPLLASPARSLVEPNPALAFWRHGYDDLLARYLALPTSRPHPRLGNDRGGWLAWGVSEAMQSFLVMHDATADRRYLDLFVRYGDQLLDARDTVRGVPSRPDGTRVPAWRSLYGYSQGWLTLRDRYGHAALRLRVRPDASPNRPTRATVRPLADHRFDLEVRRGDGALDRFLGLSTDPRDERYAPRYVRAHASHSLVTIAELRRQPSGLSLAPVTGAVVPPQPYVHPSHTGAIVAPLAAFARRVASTPALHDRYVGAARRFREAAIDALAVHDREWRHDSRTGEGYYVFLRGDPWYLDGTELPLNEFLTLARAYNQLAQLPGADGAWSARTHAMARTFHRALHHDARHDAVTWTYWLPRGWVHRGWGLDDRVSEHRPVQSPVTKVEDVQHAALDVQVAAELVAQGHLPRTDGVRLANTYVRLMSRSGAIAGHVDGSGPFSANPLAAHYVPLARWRPEVYDHARSLVAGRLRTLPVLAAHLHGIALLAREAALRPR